MTTGYSNTPLAKKLGIKEGFKVLLVNDPQHYFKLFEGLPEVVFLKQKRKESADFIHAFFYSHKELKRNILKLKMALKQDGMIWISWPKGGSKIKTDSNRELIRDYLLGIGLVDIKVAAIDEDWSGLKFVYRLKDRV